MKSALVLLGLLVAANAAETNPIGKVLQMLDELKAKIVKEGEAEHATFEEYTNSVVETSANLQFEIKTGKQNAADLQAAIQKASSNIDSCTMNVEELAAKIASAEADFAAATKIRDSEKSDFVASEKELSDIIDTITRAIIIIEREMNGGASMLQLQKATNVVQALAALVQASALGAQDANRLTALVQSQDSDEDAGAPDPEAYKSHSSGIIDVLNKMKDEATDKLESARAEENAAQNAYDLLAQGLQDEIKYANKDRTKATACVEKNKQEKATAEGDLAVTKEDLANDIKDLADLHHEAQAEATRFEGSVKSRNEELEALSTASKVIKEATGGATDLSYSLLQVESSSSNAVRVVRELAQKYNNPTLAQLASRISSVMHYSTGSRDDIFAKVKGLIRDMIEKLSKEAEEDATHKAYCDKELAETKEKKADKEGEIAKLSTQIDKNTARSAKLKEEVATLQEELAALAKLQAQMNKIREEEKANFAVNSEELKKGIAGVKAALKVLREYYAKGDKGHEAAEGAGGSIIGLLEVCESDFSTGLAEATATEEEAARAYDDQSKDNEITLATKEQDVKYKTKEGKELDKATAEATSDREGVQAELDAVNEYLSKLNEQCVAKAEPYAERKARREAEIAGLKEALEILDGEAALIQTSRRVLRGAKPHAA